jgi:hypothetical protein
MKHLLVLILLLAALAWLWWASETYSIEMPVPGRVALPAVKRAMLKMGPGYDYRMEGEILRVSTDGGKTWQRLRY